MPRQQSSPIWDHFTRSDDGYKATCNLCQAVFICRNHGTSSLAYHLKHKHAQKQDDETSGPSNTKRQKTLPFVAQKKLRRKNCTLSLLHLITFRLINVQQTFSSERA